MPETWIVLFDIRVLLSEQRKEEVEGVTGVGDAGSYCEGLYAGEGLYSGEGGKQLIGVEE